MREPERGGGRGFNAARRRASLSYYIKYFDWIKLGFFPVFRIFSIFAENRESTLADAG